MTAEQTAATDPYEGQRTTPGPVNTARYTMAPPVDFESPDTFRAGLPI